MSVETISNSQLTYYMTFDQKSFLVDLTAEVYFFIFQNLKYVDTISPVPTRPLHLSKPMSKPQAP